MVTIILNNILFTFQRVNTNNKDKVFEFGKKKKLLLIICSPSFLKKLQKVEMKIKKFKKIE